ncbi:MAG: hypothetical protein RRC34_09590 [Lentisphaeria bacterium]|nr:hypothetical protein [Lentisphaeria bacterium]
MQDDANHFELRPGLSERVRARKARMVGHLSHSFKEAEDWDLDFWQSVGPEERLSALVDLRNDLSKVEEARGQRHEYGS